MNNEKLKIALCWYLPYGVKVQYEGILNGKERSEAYSEWKIRNQFKDFFDGEQLILPDEEIGLKVAPLKTITQYKKYWLAQAGIRQFKSFYNGNGFKPLLFPIQSLTKEIRLADYNNGLPFVPIVEILKIANKEWYEKKIGTRYAEIEYKETPSSAIAWFSYMSTKSINLYIPMPWMFPLWIIDLLNRWKIDYRGLIEEGLAIEVNEENNPYL